MVSEPQHPAPPAVRGGGGGLLTTAILVLILARNAGGPSPPAPVAAPPSSPPPAAPSTAADPCDDSAVVFDDIDEFLGSENATHRRPRPMPEAVIATVPDPVDAHDGWMFDERVDAIERAVEDVGYHLTRHWLPWECIRKGLKDGRGPGVRRTFRGRAGLMVFQRGMEGWQKQEPVLLVALVGETPTWGIDTRAFQEALKLVEKYDARHGRVRVLGPSYSGSVDSLAAELRRSHKHFRLVSGSATSVDVRRLRKRAWPAWVNFTATVLPDPVMSAALCLYLSDHGVDPRKSVGMLVESTTVYGSGRALPPESYCTPRFLIPFAMQIAQTRSAYEHDVQLKQSKEKGAKDLPEAPRRGLELSLDDDGVAQDLVPSQTPAMTAATNELMLAGLLSAVSKEDVQYMGILATDSRDKLFLGRKLYESVPNVRLFTYETDLLYAHPDYRDYLEGMLVVSAYPMFPRTQILRPRPWTDHRLIGLTTQGAQGTYNAALVLLGHTDRLLDYEHPVGDGRRRRRLPSVWISAVGHAGLWPLAVYSPADLDPSGREPSYTFSAPESPRERARPPASAYLVSGSSACALMLLVLAFAALAHAHVMRPKRDAPASASTRRWHWASLALLVALAGMVALGSFLGWSAELAVGAKASTGLLRPDRVLVFSFAVVIAAVLWAGVLGPGPWESTGRRIRAALFVVAVWLAVWIAVPIRNHVASHVTEIVFALERNTDLSSGLSVAVPLVCVLAIFYLWCWANVHRCRLEHRHLAENPLAHADGWGSPVASSGIAAVEALLHRWCAAPIRSMLAWRYRWGLAAMVGGLLLISWLQVGARLVEGASLSLEGRMFDIPFWLLGTAAQVVVLFEGARVIGLWLDLRYLLRMLTFHPILDSCGRLSPRLKQTLRSNLYAYIPAVTDFRPAVQRWHVLMDKLPAAREELQALTWPDSRPVAALPSLQAWDAGLDTTFTRALEKEPRTHRDATRALAAEYAGRATLLVGVLRRVWDRRMGDPAPTPGKARTPGDEWIDLAQEFVATSVVLSVAYKCEQLRSLGVFVLSSALLVLLANTSYAFQPQQLFTMLAVTTVVGAIGILLWVFIQMERDELLNRAGGTSGGRMTLDGPFVAKIVTMVGLPLATLIASQVPQVGRFLGSLLAAAR